MIEIIKTIEGSKEQGLIFACNVANAEALKKHTAANPPPTAVPIVAGVSEEEREGVKEPEPFVPETPEEYFNRVSDIWLDSYYEQSVAASDAAILKVMREKPDIRDQIEGIAKPQKK